MTQRQNFPYGLGNSWSPTVSLVDGLRKQWSFSKARCHRLVKTRCSIKNTVLSSEGATELWIARELLLPVE